MAAPTYEALLPPIPTAETQSEPVISSPKTVGRFNRMFRALFAGSMLAIPAAGMSEAGEPSSVAGVSVPKEKSGTFFLVGGGAMDPELEDHFFELAKPENGDTRLVIIPSASERANRTQDPVVFLSGSSRLKYVDVLHATDQKSIDMPHFRKKLNAATAVWLSGGNQNRLQDIYGNTEVVDLLRGVLKRGGVMGGTSAGTAVVPKRMIGGGEVEPDICLGFDVFEGDVFIDQHFKQRGRQRRMEGALVKHPGCIGLGIDESTALIVREGMAYVRGKHAVHHYAPSTHPDRKFEVELLREGGRQISLSELMMREKEAHGDPMPVTMAP